MDLTTVATELYGLPPDQFTAARNDRVKAARDAGDRALATAIGKLRRPTTSAWLANLLVRESREQVVELLELGAALRDAQGRLAGDQLRALFQQRHVVVSALAREVRGLAAAAGDTVSDQVERELAGTLEAALADQEAAAALESGQLTTALSYSGIGGVDLGSERVRPAAEPSRTQSAPSRRRPAAADAETQRRARLHAAETDAREAQQAAERAAAEAAAARRRVDDARRERDDVRERIARLEHELRELQNREAGAARDLRTAERAAEASTSAAQRAHQGAEKAQSRLSTLRNSD